MSIRLPLQAVLSYSNVAPGHGGPASVAGGVAKTFNIPQDTDNIVVKLQASIVGGGVSATFQTTDDGGATWYDVQRSSIVSNTAGGYAAEWMSIPVVSAGNNLQSSVVATGSVVTNVGTIGSSAASTLGVGEVSGLPIMSPAGRIFLRYTAAVSSIQSESVTVSANSQSATA